MQIKDTVVTTKGFCNPTPSPQLKVKAPFKIGAIDKTRPSAPNALRTVRAETVEAPNSIDAQASVKPTAPNAITAESKGQLSLPNVLTSVAEGGLLAPELIPAQPKLRIANPNTIAAESSESVLAPNLIGAQSAGRINNPVNLSAISSGKVVAPNEITAQPTGDIDLPNAIPSQAAGVVLSPTQISAESAGSLDLPNVIGAIAAGEVLAPVIIGAESAGQVLAPNAITSLSKGQLSNPNDILSVAAGEVLAPVVIAPVAKGQLSSPNIIGSVAALSVLAPNAILAESEAKPSAPNVITPIAYNDMPPFPETHGRIMFDNLLVGAAASVSAGTGEAATLNPNTFEGWSGDFDGGFDDITYTLPEAVQMDTVCLGSHNFGSNVINVSIRYSVDDVSGFVEVANLDPTTNAPIMATFSEVTVKRLRVILTKSTADDFKLYVVYGGVSLQLQRPKYGGVAPAPLNAMTEYFNNRSQAGEWLGRSIRRTGFETSLDLVRLTPTWYRTYFQPFVESAKVLPFFYSWRPADYPDDVVYCWTESDISPSNSGTREFMDVSFNVKCHGY